MNRRTITWSLSLIAAVALAARVGLMVHLRAWEHPNAMEHELVASALAAGQGFTFADWNYYGPTSVQSPPMPLLLAGLFKLNHAVTVLPSGRLALDAAAAARSYKVVLLINAAAGAALVWLTYGAARTIGATPAAGLVAAALVAVWPTQVYAAASVQVIAWVTCGLAGMVILYYRAVRIGSAGAWAGYSVVGAVLALTEPVVLPALVASGALVLIARRLTVGQRVRNGAVLALITAAVIGPWATRNYVVHGRLIPVKGSFWVNVWKGNNDFATGTDRLKMTAAQEARIKKRIAAGLEPEDTNHAYDMLDLSQKTALLSQPEPKREDLFKRYATEWISTHRARYAQLCGIRLVKTLTVDWDNPKSLYKSYVAARAAVLLLTLGGLVVAWRQRWSLLFPAVVAGCALLTYTLTVTAARFAFPFEPLQLILGGGMIAGLASWAAGRAGPRRRVESRREFEPMMAVAAH